MGYGDDVPASSSWLDRFHPSRGLEIALSALVVVLTVVVVMVIL
jgi:hypothetical protein